MRLPAGSFHNLSESRAALALEQSQDLGFLAPVARYGGLVVGAFRLGNPAGRFAALVRLLAPLRAGFRFAGPHRGGWGRFLCAGVQTLDRFPDPADGRLLILELLYRREARDAVPDLDQPVRRPLRNQAGQLLLAAEALALAGILLTRERRDAVLCVDHVRFHVR